MKTAVSQSFSNCDETRRRFLETGKKPLFLGNWERVLFIHYEVPPETLQPLVPFELDLWRGAAFVSVVVFSMRRLRPGFGGKWTETLLRPIANHEFLNVRTYVRHGGRRGIYFMAEWVNNPISLVLGPWAYGLPYRFGRIDYRHDHEIGRISGRVADNFSYAGRLSPATRFQACERDSLDEFLLERYSAFTRWLSLRRAFNIWHEPWPQCEIDLDVHDELLRETGPWFDKAHRIGANYSPGVGDIWMGAPQRVN